MARQCNGRRLQARGYAFDSRLLHYHVTSLAKLFLYLVLPKMRLYGTTEVCAI